MKVSNEFGAKRSRLALLMAIGIMALFSGRAWAVTLTNTNISQATFDSLAGAAVNSALVSTYDFSPATAGGDGEIRSQVFEGEGDAAGLFVYIYQIVLYSTSSAVQEEGISFNFVGGPSTVSGMTSFYIGTTPSPPAPFDPGVQEPSGASFTDPSISFAFLAFMGDQINKGEASFVFGAFSPLPPRVVSSNVIDSTSTVVDPSVYAPAPEPTGLLLLGSGLAGLGFFGRRRRRALTRGTIKA